MQKHLLLRLLAVLLGFTLVASACGDDDSDSGEAADSSSDSADDSEDVVEATQDGSVLAAVDGQPVLCSHGPVTVASFHPELSGDSRLHRRWLIDAGLLPEGLAEASDETAEVTP